MTIYDTSGTPGDDSVCNLPADQLKDRIATLRRDVFRHAKRRESLADGVAFEFTNTPEMQKTLEDLIAFERECCSGLSWPVDRVSGESLQLRVEGVPPDSDIFRILDAPEGRGITDRLSRFLRAGGLGTFAALVVCCLVPIVGAAVLGTVAAMPLSLFEEPLVVVTGAVLFAIPAWFWLKRRNTREVAVSCGKDC